MLPVIAALVCGIVIGWRLCGCHGRRDGLSAAWFKDRLQLGRDNHE